MTSVRQVARLAAAALAVALTVAPGGAVLAQGQGRPDVMGTTAALSSDHPLATAAGADVLRRGGNAIDAAITMAAVLGVVRPHMNGVGGDAFLLYRDGKTGRIYALNGSGRAGSRATPAFFRDRHLASVPSTGVLSVSVPGAVRLWGDALARFGTVSLARALAPAIDYAERGFPVSTRLAADITEERNKIAADTNLARLYLPGGAAPAVGSLLREPDLARTLRVIAAQGPDALYTGELATAIAAFMAREGGLLTRDDLARHRSTWQEPITTTYHGYTVVAFPPNTQGVTLLEMLGIAEHADLKAMGWNTADYVHTLAEVTRLAYADRDRLVADPAFASVPVERLLSPDYARELARRLKQPAAADARSPERDDSGDTVYLCVIDKDGNAVSYIQSLFAGFGSGRMVPGTGIILHNRGSLYTLDASHPNVIAPGKRPFHTLSPAMVLRADKSLAMVLGTPGGDGQPQTITQVLNNVVTFGMTPQQAVEAPRWRVFGSGRLSVEPGIAEPVRGALERRGHAVTVQPPGAEFGGAQMILVQPSGAKLVGSDPRREAFGIAW